MHFGLEALQIGGGEPDTLERDLRGFLVELAGDERGDDFGDRNLKAGRVFDDGDIVATITVPDGVVKAAEAASAKGGLSAGQAAGARMNAARSEISFLVIVVHMNTGAPGGVVLESAIYGPHPKGSQEFGGKIPRERRSRRGMWRLGERGRRRGNANSTTEMVNHAGVAVKNCISNRDNYL